MEAIFVRYLSASLALSLALSLPFVPTALAQDGPKADPQPGDEPLLPPEEPKPAAPPPEPEKPRQDDEAAKKKAAEEAEAREKAEAAAKLGDPAAEAHFPYLGDRPLRGTLSLTVGPLSFLPILLVQAQALPYVGDDSFTLQGDPADSEGFRLRRGRLGLEVRLADQGRGRVSVELGSREDGTARIQDAWIAYVGFPYLQAWGGAMRVPFSRSQMVGSGDQSLTERPLAVRSMTPGQQVGISARGDVADRAFSYDLGVFNGFERFDQFYAGYRQNHAPLGNRFEGLAYVARLATEPIGPLSRTIADETHQTPRFGIGANYFYSDGAARGESVAALLEAAGERLVVLDNYEQLLPAGARVLERWLAAAPLLRGAVARGFHFLAEAIYSVVSPKSDPEAPTATVAEVQSLGIVAEAGYMILRDLLGVTARFEYIDPSSAVDDEGDNWLVGGGPTVMFFEGMVRLTAEYTHREEMFGLSLENDAVILQAQLVVP